MASRRVAKNILMAARLRPTIASHVQPASFTAVHGLRYNSNVPAEDPKSRAKSIIDALPGNSLISKTAILSAGTGLSIAAISNELYVVNEETIVMIATLSVFWAAAHYGGPMYKEWAEGYANKVKGILNSARKDHTTAVQSRIESVQQLGGVVDITKSLFAVSKETAELEAQAFELEQKTALAAEAKSVLESWVRYEGQVKARQQKELSETIIAKIEKELQDPKVLKNILDQSVKDVERILAQKPT